MFVFVPGGQGGNFMKQFSERGLDKSGIGIIGPGDVMDDDLLNGMGDAALGAVTAHMYSAAHPSRRTRHFVGAYQKIFNSRPGFVAVGGYDGIHLIYEALRKTGGKTDGDALVAAMKGMAWESPRGPISIDPETRDIVQNIYMRKVEKVERRTLQCRIRDLQGRQGRRQVAEVALSDVTAAIARRHRIESVGQRRRAGLQDQRRLDLDDAIVAHRRDASQPGRCRIRSGTTFLPHHDARITRARARRTVPARRSGLWRPWRAQFRENVDAAGDLDQLGYPADTADQRIVPFLEIDPWAHGTRDCGDVRETLLVARR